MLLANCQNLLGWTPLWNARQWGGFSSLLNKGVQKETRTKRIRSTVQTKTAYQTEEGGREGRHTVQHRLESEAGLNIQGGWGGAISHR